MLRVFAVPGIPEIAAGDDLATIIGDALAERGGGEVGGVERGVEHGDILVITSKIVSKAEGRQIADADRESAITAETVRVVATRRHAHGGGVTRIVENRLGLVMAAAGVDASNTPEGTVLLLPVDPDASARTLAAALRARFGVHLGIVISDTFGRPWRQGQTDGAIGAAGIRVLDDLRGTVDSQGRRLDVTVAAVADEIASAADLVKGKASGNPVAVVRGLAHLVTAEDGPGARALVRLAADDMFRLGTEEAFRLGFEAGQAAIAGDAPGGAAKLVSQGGDGEL